MVSLRTVVEIVPDSWSRGVQLKTEALHIPHDVGEPRILAESSAVSGGRETTACRRPGRDRSVTQMPKGHLRGPLEFRLC